MRFERGLIFAAAILLTAGICQAQVKLYLKDGSYQLVKSYEIQGNRVRYYSLERGDWEYIPRSMVDFAATRRSAKERDLRQQQILKEAVATEKNSYTAPQNAGYQIAPGVRLPLSDGVYAFDGIRAMALVQSESSIVRDKKRLALNLALPAPILKARALAEIPGKAAAVRIFSQRPVFYIHLSEAPGSSVELLRLKAGKNYRTVETIDSGSPSKSSPSVIATAQEQVAPGVIQLKPLQPLAIGEYAIVEVEGNKLNLDVWDFGVDALKTNAR